jgi:hypothetical protein
MAGSPPFSFHSVAFSHRTQRHCQLVPHAQDFVLSNPNQKPPAQSSVDVPVPCATCRGHSHFLRSFFISPFGANSRAARPFRSPSYLRFLSMLPHFSQSFRRATWLPFVFSNAGSRQFSLFYCD